MLYYWGAINELIDDIKSSRVVLFAVMVDDTRDVPNLEQMSMCLRYFLSKCCMGEEEIRWQCTSCVYEVNLDLVSKDFQLLEGTRLSLNMPAGHNTQSSLQSSPQGQCDDSDIPSFNTIFEDTE